MIRFSLTESDAGPEGAMEIPSADSLRARIASMAPAEAKGTPGRDAAMVLLASVYVGHNVDRIARFTGVRRDMVARCARRLVDNGVWRDGDIVCRWLDTKTDTDSFWADVAVAEGKWCRRIGEDGQMEWAPQGYWRKHYDYAGPREAEQPQIVCYHPHIEPGSQDLPRPVEQDDEEELAVPVGSTWTSPTPTAGRSEQTPAPPPLWMGTEEVSVPSHAWSPELDSTEELFPDAVWLG